MRCIVGQSLGRGLMMPALITAVLAITAVSLLFRSQIAATVLLAPFDDGLFLRLAGTVREGKWLGEYDNLTLAKGPAYPVFLALVEYLHLPLKLTEHAIYLVAAAGMALVVHRLSRSIALGLILYAALALNPVMWGLGLARIIRDGFYVAVTLGAVAMFVWLLLANLSKGSAVPRRGMLMALPAGVLLAFFWLTREEGVWLVPALSVVVVGSASLSWVTDAGRTARATRSAWRPVLAYVGLRLVLMAISAATIIGAVAAINSDRYGVGLVNDLTGGSFPAAYGALARIEHEATDRYVPVPAIARADAYRASPAAAELEPFLDGESGAQWAAIGCGGPPDPDSGCSDIRGGWFMWAMRQAVDLAGHWSSAAAAQAYLSRLAGEVNSACDAGRLACGPPRSSVAPAVGLGTLIEASAHAIPGLSLMIGDDPPVRTGVSAASPEEVLRVALRFGPVAPLATTPSDQMRIHGWVAGTAGVPNVALVGRGDRSDAPIVFDPAPDVDAFFEARGEVGFSSRRFEIITDCVHAECSLLVRGVDGEERQLRITSLRTGPVLHSSSLWLFVDEVGSVRTRMEEVLDSGTARGHPRILAAMQWVQGAFGLLVPIGLTFGMAGVGLAVMRSELRARFATLLVLASACAVAVAARLMVIALIEVTSWPGAMSGLYLAPGSPFLLTFTIVGSYLGLKAVTAFVRRKRRSAPDTG